MGRKRYLRAGEAPAAPPRAFLADPQFTPLAKLVYVYLSGLMNQTQEGQPMKAGIAEGTGLKDWQVGEAMRQLRKAGLVERVAGKGGGPDFYRLLEDENWRTTPRKTDAGGVAIYTSSCDKEKGAIYTKECELKLAPEIPPLVNPPNEVEDLKRGSTPPHPSGSGLSRSKELESLCAGEEQEKAPSTAAKAEQKKRHTEFIAGWFEAYKLAHGVAYVMQKERDPAAVKRIVAAQDVPVHRLLECAKRAWHNEKDFNCGQARTIAGFVSRFNYIYPTVMRDVIAKDRAEHAKLAKLDRQIAKDTPGSALDALPPLKIPTL